MASIPGIQGISYALFEDRILDRNTAIMVNPNLEQYKIAGSKEMPVIEPIVIEYLQSPPNRATLIELIDLAGLTVREAIKYLPEPQQEAIRAARS